MHQSTHNETIESVAVLAVIVLIIARRLRGRPVHGRRQPIVITVLVLYGAGLIGQAVSASHPSRLTGGDLALLATSAVISLAMGGVRGTTVELFDREGRLHSRYKPLTVVLWLVTLAIRLGIDSGSAHFGAAHLVAQSSLIMMFGLSLAGETIVVRARAARQPTTPAGGVGLNPVS